MRLLALALAVAVASPLAAAADAASLKDVVSDSVRTIRALQNPDGSYGPADTQPRTTIRVLRALATSPDHYTAQDGPFVRGAADAVIAALAAAGPDDKTRAEALLALNLTAKGARYDAAKASLADARGQLDERGPLTWVDRHLLDGESIDPDGRWFTAVHDRLIREQTDALATLDVAGLPAATDRLLALNELVVFEKSRAGDDASSATAEATRRAAPTTPDEARARIEHGLRYLEGVQQSGRFGFHGAADAGITGIALSAVLRTCDRLEHPRPEWVAEGLDYLASLQKEDGGIYDIGLKNYVTSVAVEALVASGDPAYAPNIERATAFLMATQLDEDEGYSSELDPYYGGFGYGSSEKPDLSNTQMALQAMHDAGVPTDEAAFTKAVLFLERCQNRKETGIDTMTTWDDKEVVAGTDGGAVYRPGDSKAGTDRTADGGLVGRSYGSMTYALLKSYLFAGLDPEDPRVNEAVDWIARNYRLDVNPGFRPDGRAEYQGLYYYYLTMARALRALGRDTLDAPDGGAPIDWAGDLRRTLYELQAEDGHWVNDRAERWMEGNPTLTTAYALLALAEIEG